MIKYIRAIYIFSFLFNIIIFLIGINITFMGVNVDDLLNSEWLKEVIIEQQEIEKILKDEFYNNYYMLKESQELFNNYNHQINLASIIDNDEMGEAFSQNNIIGEFVTKINKLDEKR